MQERTHERARARAGAADDIILLPLPKIPTTGRGRSKQHLLLFKQLYSYQWSKIEFDFLII